MTTRTVRVLGMGFGSSPAAVTATLNGEQIFTGNVPTVDQPIPSLPDPSLTPDQQILFTFEIDQAFTGQIPMTCTINNGTVIFGEILTNYLQVFNPVYTEEQTTILNSEATTMEQRYVIWTQVATPAFTTEETAILLNPATSKSTIYDILTIHNAQLWIPAGPDYYASIDGLTDPRAQVSIDGIAQLPDRSDLPGTWWWSIPNSSTLSYLLEVQT